MVEGPEQSMTRDNLNLLVASAGVVLSSISVVLVLGSSLAVGICLGAILGVLLAPWIRRAAAWLNRYLGG